MSCGSSHSSLRHLATYAHHGVRSVKQLQITIHFGVLSWALSKCSKLGRTCLLRSVTINSSYMLLEFMNSVVVHLLSLFMHVEALHYYTKVSATNINLRTAYNELYSLSEPKILRSVYGCFCIIRGLKLPSFGFSHTAILFLLLRKRGFCSCSSLYLGS